MGQGDFADATAIYERAEINGTMGFGERLALLVVDFTHGFTDPESPIGSDMTPAVEATRELIRDARAAGLPIFFTIHGYRPDLADVGVWGRKFPSLRHLKVGTRWTELDDRLGAQDEDVVFVKQYPSAFFGTVLVSMLNTAGIDTVVVAGTTTSGCIRASVVDAVQYGFRAFVAEDCVADRAQAPHEANLFDLRMKYADVGPSSVVRDHLAHQTSA
jgi:nicotinamidase-related amidase